MTAAGLHHLPEPDHAAVDALIATLARLGIPVTPGQAAKMHTAHEFGLLMGEDGIGRVLVDSSPKARAARARQQMRAHRAEASAETKFHNSQPHSAEFRLWKVDADGLGFTCRRGHHMGGFIDSRQTTEAAVAHHKQCREVSDV
ncbi:hypothetical protein ABZ249_30300 [Nocardiopsis sp. NPDC006139]|uniref:hypothetical protein n=1 Tax=Nocardiopsis sp. NPDC006139 TaxID=3154578 RepID=UPI0033BC4B43